MRAFVSWHLCLCRSLLQRFSRHKSNFVAGLMRTFLKKNRFYENLQRCYFRTKDTKYKNIIDEKSISPGYFLFQYVTIYLLYHEVGHLIQRSPEEPEYLEFIHGHIPGNTIHERHIREHDADWFSASQIGFHLLEFV